MPILAVLIGYNQTILVNHSPYTTQFLPLATTILPKISSRVMSYVYDRFYFHYISGLSNQQNSGFVFMCMTGEDTTGAIEFLQKVQSEFTTFLESKTPRSESTRLLAPEWNTKDLLQVSNDFYPQLQGIFKANAEPNSQILSNELTNLQSIMAKNVDLVLARGEQLDSIMERTQDLVDSSQAFRRSSRQVGYQMWWQNRKITIVGVVVLIFVISITVYLLL